MDKDGYETYIAVDGSVHKIKPIPLFDMPPPAVGLPLDNHRMVEFMTLDEIEAKYGKEARDKAAKIQAEAWAKETLEKNKSWTEKEQERMFEEMLLIGRTYIKIENDRDIINRQNIKEVKR